MRFVTKDDISAYFKGKSVAIVGSGPGALGNKEGLIDWHDIVVRVNNYKTGIEYKQLGFRCDVHYSFYGTSIKKSQYDLMRDGVKYCMCKCPNSKPLRSEWHEKNGMLAGIDYRYIYESRKDWWFCDTYIPDDADFLAKFNALELHQPTSGMACIMDILSFDTEEVFLTGFDFFDSGVHNVNEAWRPGRPDDPIKHDPAREKDWLKKFLAVTTKRVSMDKAMAASVYKK